MLKITSYIIWVFLLGNIFIVNAEGANNVLVYRITRTNHTFPPQRESDTKNSGYTPETDKRFIIDKKEKTVEINNEHFMPGEKTKAFGEYVVKSSGYYESLRTFYLKLDVLGHKQNKRYQVTSRGFGVPGEVKVFEANELVDTLMFDLVLTTREIKDDGTIVISLDKKEYQVKPNEQKKIYTRTFTRTENVGVYIENGKPKAKKRELTSEYSVVVENLGFFQKNNFILKKAVLK